jgi:hypothetical protein
MPSCQRPWEEEPLARLVAQVALVPLAAFQQAELAAQLARQLLPGVGHGQIVGRPWVGGDAVFAPARVAPGLLLHLEDQKIAVAAAKKLPRGAQAGHAAADDDRFDSRGAPRGGEARPVAKAVPGIRPFRVRLEDEAALDARFGFRQQAGDGECKFPPVHAAHRTISRHSRS